MSLAANIRKNRLANGETQEQLAKQLWQTSHMRFISICLLLKDVAASPS